MEILNVIMIVTIGAIFCQFNIKFDDDHLTPSTTSRSQKCRELFLISVVFIIEWNKSNKFCKFGVNTSL